jgi:hypothetical protein
MILTVKITVFCDVTPYSLVDIYQRFGRTYFFYLQASNPHSHLREYLKCNLSYSYFYWCDSEEHTLKFMQLIN